MACRMGPIQCSDAGGTIEYGLFLRIGIFLQGDLEWRVCVGKLYRLAPVKWGRDNSRQVEYTLKLPQSTTIIQESQVVVTYHPRTGTYLPR